MIVTEMLTVAAITNAALLPRDERASMHWFCMMGLLLGGSAQRLWDHAVDGEGLRSWQSTSCARADLHKGGVRGLLDDYQVKVRRYERTCGKSRSDRLKIAGVQKRIENEGLRRDLLMHATRLSSYTLMRE